MSIVQKLAEASEPTTRGRQTSQDVSHYRGCEACGLTELLATDAQVASCFKFESKSLVNRRPENMLDLMRAGDGVEVCGSSRMTSCVSCMGCGSHFDLASGCIGRPCGRAQCRGASLARSKGFRFSDGFPWARIIRMGSLKEGQHPSSACCGVKRDLPELVFPEWDLHSAGVPHLDVPYAAALWRDFQASCCFPHFDIAVTASFRLRPNGVMEYSTRGGTSA